MTRREGGPSRHPSGSPASRRDPVASGAATEARASRHPRAPGADRDRLPRNRNARPARGSATVGRRTPASPAIPGQRGRGRAHLPRQKRRAPSRKRSWPRAGAHRPGPRPPALRGPSPEGRESTASSSVTVTACPDAAWSIQRTSAPSLIAARSKPITRKGRTGRAAAGVSSVARACGTCAVGSASGEIPAHAPIGGAHQRDARRRRIPRGRDGSLPAQERRPFHADVQPLGRDQRTGLDPIRVADS
jgi:hypothetical protein